MLEDDGSKAWLHCHGMEKWNLPNIEFMDVPRDLLGYGHGIMLSIVGYMKSVKSINENENLGGMFTSENQSAIHQCTMRRSPESDSEHRNMLRVVDLGQDASARFPYKLFAAHLISVADEEKILGKREWLYRKAIEIYEGSSHSSALPEDEHWQNPNNYFAWEGLGMALVDAGRVREAIKCFERAAVRWPIGAQALRNHLVQQISNGALPPADQNECSRFWNDFKIEEILAKFSRE